MAHIDEQRYARRIAHTYFIRFHMSLILAAVIGSGVLTSKALLELGVHALRLRYPIGVLVSYLVFLTLVRIWIWYVTVRSAVQCGIGNLDLGGSGFDSGDSSGAGGFGGFGGGDSGGAGASSSWDDDGPVTTVSSSSGWLPKLDLDCDLDDGWWILVLLAVLAIAILGAGGYLVYAAPHILPEAAGQALLATTLTRVSKPERHSWMTGVFRATCIPFAIVLILASILGWEAHRHCPAASRLIDVFRCSSR
ncbi:MAG: hypothetical protein JWP63_1854 [Candidatus Solibacter sp.]|jgi:hypothetical protein|nr:hypothetical protein [Candidatus Solibacter sp.]